MIPTQRIPWWMLLGPAVRQFMISPFLSLWSWCSAFMWISMRMRLPSLPFISVRISNARKPMTEKYSVSCCVRTIWIWHSFWIYESISTFTHANFHPFRIIRCILIFPWFIFFSYNFIVSNVFLGIKLNLRNNCPYSAFPFYASLISLLPYRNALSF